MLQVCSSTSVCRSNRENSKAPLHLARCTVHTLLVGSVIKTHVCWEGFLSYCYRGPVGRGQHEKTATSVPVFPDPFVPSHFKFPPHGPGQGKRTYGTRAQNDTRTDLLGTRHSLLCQYSLFRLPDHSLCIVKNICIYTHM